MKATEILKEEHQVIERVISALEKAANRLNRGEDVYLRFFIGTSVLMKGFTDSYHHKKEEVLISALVNHGLPKDTGPLVIAMLAEHEEGRRLSQLMRQLTERLQAGDVRARPQVVQSALGYVKLLRKNIYQENNYIFPLVEKVLPPNQQEQLVAAFERFETREDGEDIHEKYYGLADRLVRECVR